MGPYYLTALISLLGPIRRVTGSAQMSFPERQITSQPLSGQTIVVETPYPYRRRDGFCVGGGRHDYHVV